MNAPHKPLVVLVATAQRDLKQTAKDVGELARKWRDARGRAPVVFAWMDADKWGKWLKSMYGIKAGGLPRAVVANHTRLVYWDTDQFGETISLTSASVFSAVNGAMKGTIPYKHSENAIERLARVCALLLLGASWTEVWLQYLNDKLVSVETYVTTNPWHTALWGFVLLIALLLGIRRLLSDTEDSREGGYLRKGGRLD